MRRLKLKGVAACIESHIMTCMRIYRCQYVGGQIACCIVGFLSGNNGILIESIGRIIICIVHIVIFICISTRYLFPEINIVTSFHDSIRINSSRDRYRWRRQSFRLDRSQSRFIPVNGIWLEHGHEIVLCHVAITKILSRPGILRGSISVRINQKILSRFHPQSMGIHFGIELAEPAIIGSRMDYGPVLRICRIQIGYRRLINCSINAASTSQIISHHVSGPIR